MAKKKDDEKPKLWDGSEPFDMLSLAVEQAKNFDMVVTNSSVIDFGIIKNAAPTGILAIDYMLRGGFPTGRYHLMWGRTQTCKSTLAYSAAAKAQQRREPVLLYDAEHAADEPYLQKLGIDTNRKDFVYIDPTKGEDVFKHMINTCKAFNDLKVAEGVAKPKPFVIMDSFASMIPELQWEEGKDPTAALARLLSAWLRLAVGGIALVKGTFIAINQARQIVSMNPMGPKGDTQPGGNAPQQYTNVEFKTSGLKRVEGEDDAIMVTYNLKKARHVKPFQSVDLKFYLGRGFCKYWDLWQYLVRTGQADALPGGWYKISLIGDVEDNKDLIGEGKNKRWNEIVEIMDNYNLHQWAHDQLMSGILFEGKEVTIQEQEGDPEELNQDIGEAIPDPDDLPTMTEGADMVKNGKGEELGKELDEIEKKGKK